MIGYYILLFLSALIFSLQFLVTKQYERYQGSGFRATVKLSFIAYLAIAVFFFIKGWITVGEIRFGFSWYTFLLSLGIAVVSLSCVAMGIKVLAVGDMSLYSMFMMLGSIVMPTLTGLIFYGEELTWLKGIALALMIAAILLSLNGVDKSKINRRALLYYIGIFVMNGMIGVLFTVHQNGAAWTAGAIATENGYQVNNDLFMVWYGLGTVLLSGVVLAVLEIYKRRKKKPTQAQAQILVSEGSSVSKKTVLFLSIALPVLYGLCNGLGDYFIALGTQPHALGSSVTFPIINGGTILFSTCIGFIVYKEKCNVKTLISLAIVILSTVLFMFV